MSNKQYTFPKGFLWGSSTDSYTHEGNNQNSAVWAFEQEGKIENAQKSGMGVDFYHKFKQDFDLAKSLGQNIHNFSVEWSRIQPERDRFDDNEMYHYIEVAKDLRSKGMKVMVTLFRASLPQWFSKLGGFNNRKGIDIFLDYVRYLVNYLGEWVDFWITIDAPSAYAFNGYFKGVFPPGKRSLLGAKKMTDRLLVLNKETYFLLHSLNKICTVGVAHEFPYIEPESENSLLDKFVSRMAETYANNRITDALMPYSDFFGVNYYSRVKMNFELGGEYLNIAEESQTNKKQTKAERVGDTGREIFPLGLYKNLIKLKRYSKPIIITGSGVADAADSLRADFIIDHLIALHQAMRDGVNVVGYIYRSHLDGFVYEKGCLAKYGLISVDLADNLKRIIRK